MARQYSAAQNPDGTRQARTIVAYSAAGDVATGAGTFRIYNDSGVAWTILSVRASAGTAPTGAALTVDVNLNGTTIYGTQANQPSIPAGQNTSGKASGHSVTLWPDGGYVTVDVDAVGSTTPGADLTVQVTVA